MNWYYRDFFMIVGRGWGICGLFWVMNGLGLIFMSLGMGSWLFELDIDWVLIEIGLVVCC